MKWHPDELYILRELYPDLPASDVAALLGRKIGPVHQCAARYGIHKSAYFVAQDLSGRITRGNHDPRMAVGRFKSGQKPWNAGAKGWQAGGRSVTTQFVNGMLPPNTMQIGSYRVITEKTGQQHLEKKMREVPGANHKRWTPVSRVVWEAANGPVPAGHIIVFKPGTRTIELKEITLDRLELITRAQHAQRNHPRNKSPELGKLYQLKGAITRQVNRINREHHEKSTHQLPARQTACHP